jgi:hypothetical protein
VAAVVVIVGDVGPEQTKQVAVVDDHDAVEEPAAGDADPAFGDACRPLRTLFFEGWVPGPR